MVLFGLACFNQIAFQPLALFLRPAQPTVYAFWFDTRPASITWLPCLWRSLGRPLLFLLHPQVRLGQSLEHFRLACGRCLLLRHDLELALHHFVWVESICLVNFDFLELDGLLLVIILSYFRWIT